MSDEEAVVPQSWLQKQLTVDEAETEYMHEGIPFGSMKERSNALTS